MLYFTNLIYKIKILSMYVYVLIKQTFFEVVIQNYNKFIWYIPMSKSDF